MQQPQHFATGRAREKAQRAQVQTLRSVPAVLPSIYSRKGDREEAGEALLREAEMLSKAADLAGGHRAVNIALAMRVRQARMT